MNNHSEIIMEQEILENQSKADPRLTDGQAPRAELDSLRKRVEEIYISVEKTRKYFLWTLIITIMMIVLPLIGLVIVIPIFMRTLSSSLGM